MLLVNKSDSQPPRGPLVISPQVNADKTVTFRFLAPSAKEVKLSAQFLSQPVNMAKDTAGIWSVVTGPYAPDIYPYSFVVDGVNVMDPANTFYFPNERFKASLADIEFDSMLIHSATNVPHGTVSYEYYSSTEGTTGTLVIYTPPGYGKKSKEKYPVFYLISGTTDTEETWFKVGRINFILDNLVAAGKAKPMIVVMPYGNIEGRIAAQKGLSKPADPTDRESPDAIKRAENFQSDLLKNIIPYVEKNYSVVKESKGRAIGGFSRGGGQTLRAAFSNLSTFSWLCCYSAYLSPKEMQSNYSFIYKNAGETNKKLKLFWISVGNEDFLYKQTAAFMDFLSTNKVNFKSMVTGGGHTWMNTRQYFAATAQLLFK